MDYFWIILTMDDRTVPKIRTSTNFSTWNGFFVRNFLVWYVVRIFGTVLSTEFGPDSNLVRYVVGISVRKNPYRNKICTEQKFEKYRVPSRFPNNR